MRVAVLTLLICLTVNAQDAQVESWLLEGKDTVYSSQRHKLFLGDVIKGFYVEYVLHVVDYGKMKERALFHITSVGYKAAKLNEYTNVVIEYDGISAVCENGGVRSKDDGAEYLIVEAPFSTLTNWVLSDEPKIIVAGKAGKINEEQKNNMVLVCHAAMRY